MQMNNKPNFSKPVDGNKPEKQGPNQDQGQDNTGQILQMCDDLIQMAMKLKAAISGEEQDEYGQDLLDSGENEGPQNGGF